MESVAVTALTPQQRQLLEEFRRTIADGTLDDWTLARFLKARKFKLQDAVKMVQAHFKWRVDYGMHDIFNYSFPEFREIFDFYPHGHHKTDRIGRPIYIERLGLLNVKRLFEVTNEERLMRYFVREYERLVTVILPACAAAAGRPVEQTLTLLDLGGAGTRLMKKKVYGLIKLASNVAQENYPELLGNMLIINAPLLFSGAWMVVKPMLDEKTRAKITIIGSKFQKQLFEFADPSSIPTFLGGTCNCEGGCLNRYIGPWNPEGRPRDEFGFPQGTRVVAEEAKEEVKSPEGLDNLRSALSQGLQGEPKATASAQINETPVNTQTDDSD